MFVCRSTDLAAVLTAVVIRIQTEADHTGPTADCRPSDRLQEGFTAEQDSSLHDKCPGIELPLVPATTFTATTQRFRRLFSVATAKLTGISQ